MAELRKYQIFEGRISIILSKNPTPASIARENEFQFNVAAGAKEIAANYSEC